MVEPLRIVMVFKGVEEGNPILGNVLADLIDAAQKRGLFFEHLMTDVIPEEEIVPGSEFEKAYLDARP